MAADAASRRAAPGALSKIVLIMKREYMAGVRTKAFIVSTLLLPVFLGGLFFVPVLIGALVPAKPLRIAVVDDTGAILPALDAALASDPNEDFIRPKRRRGGSSEGGPVRRYQIEAAPAAAGGPEVRLADLARRVEEKSLDAYLVVPADVVDGTGEPAYYGRTVSELGSIRRIRQALSDVVVARRLAGAGVDAARAKELTRRVDLQTVKVGAGGEKSRRDFGEEWLLTMAYVMFLYVGIMGYGSSLARSLIEERMNKVMEVLLSSVTPFQIMAGKMLGLGAAGLTQFGIWSIAAVGLSAGRGRAAGGEAPFSVEPWMLGLFLLYFALGFFLFAALFCVVGSMCTSEQEAQNTQMPVVMLLVIPMAIALMIVQQPSSPAAVALSHVPFFAPIIMFMRISVLTPPAWEIALNVLVVLATIVASVWAAGRIFRIGILMTGKKATIPEVARWLRA